MHHCCVSQASHTALHIYRGLSLRGCEDIDNAAALILSKYTAATDQSLLQRFSSLDVAPSSTADSPQAAAGNPSKTVLPGMPTYRNTSLQRTLLSNALLGVRQAEAPSDPHQQPVLDLDSDTERTQGSQAAQVELQQQQQHGQPFKQQSSMRTGKPCWLCTTVQLVWNMALLFSCSTGAGKEEEYFVCYVQAAVTMTHTPTPSSPQCNV